MITKSFKDWDSEEVEKVFGISRLWKEFDTLEEWINTQNFTPKQEPQIEKLRDILFLNVDAWNEDELKMFFIAPLLSIVNFYHQPYYKSFTQRTLKIQTDTVDCKGDVEFLVATGRKNPEKPFFFLHEYKQEEQRTNDALGQLLIAMVAAQISNQDDMPLYGCYVLGRFWFFVVLDKDRYSVSNAYNATNEDIYKIMDILGKMKSKVESYFNLEKLK
ncbi:MAG: hypothetical protein NW226_13890 [Microscillaceae bacterium]|nr:hypothetical protein [Microscillaceae bacterium]